MGVLPGGGRFVKAPGLSLHPGCSSFSVCTASTSGHATWPLRPFCPSRLQEAGLYKWAGLHHTLFANVGVRWGKVGGGQQVTLIPPGASLGQVPISKGQRDGVSAEAGRNRSMETLFPAPPAAGKQTEWGPAGGPHCTCPRQDPSQPRSRPSPKVQDHLHCCRPHVETLPVNQPFLELLQWDLPTASPRPVAPDPRCPCRYPKRPHVGTLPTG